MIFFFIPFCSPHAAVGAALQYFMERKKKKKRFYKKKGGRVLYVCFGVRIYFGVYLGVLESKLPGREEQQGRDVRYSVFLSNIHICCRRRSGCAAPQWGF